MSYIDSLFGGQFGGPGPTTNPNSPPPGFSAQEWKQLLKMAKKNPTLDALMKKYTDAGGKNPDDAWRRVMPTDTSQLLKQLSYNAGEMGMPGGYVGAIQLPAYGETQPPVNNPDMSKYGQAPGLGEATFYQQSMKGGMAPIAAMSPLGVPEGWNPGGANDLEQQLKDYLGKLHGGGGGGGDMGNLQSSFDSFVNSNRSGFNGVWAGFPTTRLKAGSRPGGKGGGTGSGSDPGSPGTGPGRGVPISLPYGY